MADDDPTNRWLTHRQLLRLGLSAEVAENGEAAFAMLCASRYDLLLTDCHMPRMDGVALTQAVRAAADPVLRALPIIGVTADVTMAQSERCQAAGMTEVAIKPLSLERLSHMLFSHLPNQAPVTVTLPAPSAFPAAPSFPTPPDVPQAPAAPCQAAALFDDETYRDLFSPGDPDGAAWLSEYLEVSELLQEELQQLLAANEENNGWREAVAATAHRLVGSSLSVGAMSLSGKAREIEHAAAREDPSALRTRLESARNELTSTRQAMNTFITRFQAEVVT